MNSPKKWKTARFFQKIQMFDQSCSCNEEKTEPLVFFSPPGNFEAATIYFSQEENTVITTSP